ncbi:MAG: ChaN family lipoprotein [Planctomycetota bacterium]|nr:ChaN family lipoprotein [Planctomycetota bacterium]
MKYSLSSALWPVLLLATSCAGLTGSTEILLPDGEATSFEAMIDQLAGADVVVLGEEHDSDGIHALQLRTTEALMERRGKVTIAMEMFERDVQSVLNLYLMGAIEEEDLMQRSRPWGNYAEHYRGAIELARANGLTVLASNIPRALARNVGREGTLVSQGGPWSARNVIPMGGAYEEIFMDLMGGMMGHMGDMPEGALERIFEAQCIKDEAMAESIAEHLASSPSPKPQVVFWCGRFHSDFGLGTVERLVRRMPGLKIAVISGRKLSSGAFDESDQERGDFIWIAPE